YCPRAGVRGACAVAPAVEEHRAELPLAGAHAEALRLLSRPDRPSAVFCTTDDQAIGLLRAADDLGIRVPEELAVAGFDDIAEAVIAGPALTTVETGQEDMARAAVDLVLGGAEGRVTGARTFPARLVLRRSCGCPNPSGPV
ncbi:substrate-binding domain-containing protein, partial [Kitasatospora sp. NPDC093558]|uniref:substrate-binding domain-containing protein n=1 Tax=Kitasatospora sp. NPDC093558 TaxID=3155201 RepID=UPI00343E611D